MRFSQVSSALRQKRGLVVAAMVALTALGVVALLTQGGSESACTKIGCSSGISVDIGDPRSALSTAAAVEFCLNRRGCTRQSIASGRLVGTEWHGAPRSVNARYWVEVRILDGRGRTLLKTGRFVELARVRPNGSGCQPTCFVANLRLEAARRELRPVQLRSS
jgi:hypothetical protein